MSQPAIGAVPAASSASASDPSVNVGGGSDGYVRLASGVIVPATAAQGRADLGLGSLAQLSAVASAQITDGTIVGGDLSGTIALPDGATATTQGAADASTKLTTNAYADRAAGLRHSHLSIQKASAVAMTMPRSLAGNAAVAAGATGVLALWAIEIPPQRLVAFIAFHSGSTAGSALTHQWFVLCDSSRNLLAITADDTSTAWASTSEKKLAIANTAGGAAASYTTTNTVPAMFYVGMMVTAGTVPSLAGLSTLVSVNTIVPIGGGGSTSGLTTPSTFATQYSAITPAAGTPLAELLAA